MIVLVLVFMTTAAFAGLLTLRVRRLALRYAIIDVPNERSSHTIPTPRGGGLSIAIVVIVCALLLVLSGRVEPATYLIVAAAGLAVAAVGFVDDRRGLSQWFRLAVQAAAATATLVAIAALGPMDLSGSGQGGLVFWVIALLSLIWLVNLFNFMDGIDGIAGAEAVFAAVGMVACMYLAGQGGAGAAMLAMSIAGASGGFLLLNWPPARIFMGDVGSGFLGLMIGATGLLAHVETGISLWIPVILLGTFVCDATVTLLGRILRRERWYEAHRSHAYQRLSRRLGAHRPVTIGYMVVNVLWLLPLALLATRRTDLAWGCAVAAYVPLVLAAIWLGAGGPEVARIGDSHPLPAAAAEDQD